MKKIDVVEAPVKRAIDETECDACGDWLKVGALAVYAKGSAAVYCSKACALNGDNYGELVETRKQAPASAPTFSLALAWETVPEAGARLGLADLGALSGWIVEQINTGRADAGEQERAGWFVPVFRLKLQQPSLF